MNAGSKCANPALQGAAQFGRDVAAVAALLAPYTRRPLAHFRELADAAALLAVPADHVSIMTTCACSTAGGWSSCRWTAVGAVSSLEAEAEEGQPLAFTSSAVKPYAP